MGSRIDLAAAVGYTYLLHDTGLALGEGDVATRFITNKLDLDLATLTAALLIVIIIVVGDTSARALDATGLVGGSVAIADMGIVQLVGRGLVVLIGDVGHFFGIGRGLGMMLQPLLYHETKKAKSGGDTVLVVVRTTLLDQALSGEVL